MKTPEELAVDYCEPILSDDYAKTIGREDWIGTRCVKVGEGHEMFKAFLAGYAAAQPKWISVNERLPEKQMVLCNCKDGYELGYYGRYGQDQWHNTLGTDTLQVTHWMPLPEPPKEN